ncbi:hypothetical protein KP509_29G058500 [Ceratopteris richardii]|nr:hypothetical protein KP509_29G058500 [Ceratopteris richardii]
MHWNEVPRHLDLRGSVENQVSIMQKGSTMSFASGPIKKEGPKSWNKVRSSTKLNQIQISSNQPPKSAHTMIGVWLARL